MEAALADNADDVELRLKLGELYLKRGSLRKASEEYRVAAELFVRDGIPLKAVAAYLQILKLEDDAEVRVALGDLYRELGMIADAINQYAQAAARMDSTAVPGSSLAVLRKILELEPGNILVRERVVQLDPADLENLLCLATHYLEHDNPRRALARLHICHRAAPRDVRVLAALAQTFTALGQPEKAEGVRGEMKKIESSAGDPVGAPPPLIAPATEPTAPVSAREVIDKFREAVDKLLGRGDSGSRFDLGIAYKEMGLSEEAISEFDLASADPALRADALGMIALCHHLAGRLEDATKAFTEAIRTPGLGDRQKAHFYYELTKVLVERGEDRKARAAFKQAIALDPKTPRDFPGKTSLHFKAAREAFAGGGSRDAFTSSDDEPDDCDPEIPDLERRLRAHPDDVDARVELARLLVDAGRGIEALLQVEIAADQFRRDGNSTKVQACEIQIAKLTPLKDRMPLADPHCSFCGTPTTALRPPARSESSVICTECLREAQGVLARP